MAVELNKEAELALIERFRAGDDNAFDALVEATKHASYAVAFRWTRDRHSSFDITQEAYLKLLDMLPKWNGSCRVQTWLYRVVTNICVDRHRKRRLTTVPLHEVGEAAHTADASCAVHRPADEQIERKEAMLHLEQLVGGLPTRMQQAIRLRYMSGLSLREVSEIQNCSIGTIKATLFQALRKLRTRVKRLEGGLL